MHASRKSKRGKHTHHPRIVERAVRTIWFHDGHKNGAHGAPYKTDNPAKWLKLQHSLEQEGLLAPAGDSVLPAGCARLGNSPRK